MAHEMILAIPAQPPEPPPVELRQPAPTATQEQVADQALTDENQAAAAIMNLHCGVVLLHGLACQTMQREEEKKPLQRKDDGADADEE